MFKPNNNKKSHQNNQHLPPNKHKSKIQPTRKQKKKNIEKQNKQTPKKVNITREEAEDKWPWAKKRKSSQYGSAIENQQRKVYTCFQKWEGNERIPMKLQSGDMKQQFTDRTCEKWLNLWIIREHANTSNINTLSHPSEWQALKSEAAFCWASSEDCCAFLHCCYHQQRTLFLSKRNWQFLPN